MTQVKTYLACCPIVIGKGIVGIGQPLPPTVSKAKIESLLANGSIKEANAEASESLTKISAPSTDNSSETETSGGESATATLTGAVNKDGRVVELKALKVERLKALAKDLEINGADQMKKDALVEAITAVEFAVEE